MSFMNVVKHFIVYTDDEITSQFNSRVTIKFNSRAAKYYMAPNVI